MSITMKQIAEIAEVNISTVSRALNNDPSISEEVRRKILEIAYNNSYRKRRTAKTTIAYIMDKRFFLMSSNFYNHIVESIEGEVSNAGFSFQLNLLDPENPQLENINLKNIAGMIITSWKFDHFIEELIKPGIPAVLVDFYQPNRNIPAILSDKVDGVFAGIEYLYSLGHRRIAYLEGDDTLWGAQDRLIGYKRAVTNFGLEDDEKLIQKGKVSIDSGYEAMKEVLKNVSPPPTAVMGANDIVAIGAMIAIKEAGLSIPEDLSVLGYDDVDIAKEVVPKLSTMKVDKKKMGRLAVQQLLKLMEEEDPDSYKTIIKPSLVIRKSTTPAPSTLNRTIT